MKVSCSPGPPAQPPSSLSSPDPQSCVLYSVNPGRVSCSLEVEGVGGPLLCPGAFASRPPAVAKTGCSWWRGWSGPRVHQPFAFTTPGRFPGFPESPLSFHDGLERDVFGGVHGSSVYFRGRSPHASCGLHSPSEVRRSFPWESPIPQRNTPLPYFPFPSMSSGPAAAPGSGRPSLPASTHTCQMLQTCSGLL